MSNQDRKKILTNICDIIFWKLFYHLKKFYKNYGIIGIIGLLIFAFTSYAVVVTYVLGYFKWLMLWQYYDDYKNLDKVKLQHQLDYVVDMFWKPAVVNYTDEWFIENLFIKKWYILQIITDTWNRINSVWIVCLSSSFNYEIAGIKLCKSHFEDIPDYFFPLNESEWFESNKHREYYEAYWWYGFLGYKYYVFGYNELWYWDILYDMNKIEYLEFIPEKKMAYTWEVISKFRKDTIINTYFVSDIIDNWKITVNERTRFGPNYYQLFYLTPIDLAWWIKAEKK
jgi:hypothetical protein